MTALDLPDAFEGLSDGMVARESAEGVTKLAGSMLGIPVADQTFDPVTRLGDPEPVKSNETVGLRIW